MFVLPDDPSQEEWVRLWLSKLTPVQQQLVIGILKEHRQAQQKRDRR